MRKLTQISEVNQEMEKDMTDWTELRPPNSILIQTMVDLKK